MSKIKLTGHASGTGVLTVTAPNTSTDRVITLPDSTATLATTADSVGGANGVDFNDNVKARFGTGNDLEIYHSGGHSFIHDTGTGDLQLRGTDVRIKSDSDNDDMATFIENGAASLFHSNSKKLETTATGVTVTGAIAGATNLGKVLQVKHYESSGAVTFPQDTSITTTMVSGAITPSATTSKILVLQFMSFGLNGGNYPACSAKLFRDSTEIWQKVHLGYMDSNSFDRRFDFSRANYDSPNTTSEITYYLKGGNGTGSGFSGTYGGAGNKTSPGTLTLIEIGA